MVKMKEFKLLKHSEVEKLYNTKILKKGSLIKYRWNGYAITDYGLDTYDNEWYFGVVSEIMWYVVKPSIHISDDDGMLCHEIGVRDTATSNYQTINLKYHEIYLLQ